jgi:hypothetical protein
MYTHAKMVPPCGPTQPLGTMICALYVNLSFSDFVVLEKTFR